MADSTQNSEDTSWKRFFVFLEGLLRLIVGGVFIWSAVHKIQQPYEFLLAVYRYEIIGPSVGLEISRFLPWLELVLGISLWVGLFKIGGFALASLLVIVFLVAKYSVYSRGLIIPCGCGEGINSVIDVQNLVFTASFALASIAGLSVSFCKLLLASKRDKQE